MLEEEEEALVEPGPVSVPLVVLLVTTVVLVRVVVLSVLVE